MFETGLGLVLYSLDGPFKIVGNHVVDTIPEAKTIVETHLKDSGYTNLRMVDDADYSIRFVADPPKGRKGRNVASLDM